LVLIFLPATSVWADEGRDAYDDGDLDRAKSFYEERLQNEPGDMRARYNLGNVHYRAEDLQMAEEAYRMSLRSDSPEIKARAAHNLGNVRLLGGDLEGAVVAYRDALRANPGNADSRYNLELAMRLKEAVPPQPSQGDSSQQDSESSEEEQQEQGGQEQQGQEQDQQQQEQQQPEEGEDSPEPAPAQPEEQEEASEQPPPYGSSEEDQEEGERQDSGMLEPSPEDYTPEEAERVLDGLAEEERRLQAERLQAQGRRREVEKDW
jgi:hypothetical protein